MNHHYFIFTEGNKNMQNSLNLAEKERVCTGVFLEWVFEERKKSNMEYKNRDKEYLEESFIARILLKKFEVFDIKIHLPVYLLMILSLCTNENPGQTQIILKRLLTSIKDRKGPIPEGYVITTEDFSFCFQTSFPIMEIPAINETYRILWEQQKRQGKIPPMESDNLCDTVEWWKEVME